MPNRKSVSLLVLLTLCLEILAPLSAGAEETKPEPVLCPQRMDFNMEERDIYIRLHGALSHTQRFFGRPEFPGKMEARLKVFQDSLSPRQQWIVSGSAPLVDRLIHLADQYRLKNSIALTIGLDDKEWIRFERSMRQITLFESTGGMAGFTLDGSAQKLIQKIKNLRTGSGKEEFEKVKTEAILRLTEMTVWLIQWKAINGQIIQEKGSAAARQLALFAIGAVSVGVVVGTTVFSGPIVAGGGALVGGLSSDAVLSALLTRVGQVAAGGFLGMVGAPAVRTAQMTLDAYLEAQIRSRNSNTSIACELGLQLEAMKAKAPGEMLEAALNGAAMGLGGGVLTLNAYAAKLVLYTTVFGVGVAQLYSAGKLTQATMESMALYKMAQEAEDAGDFKKAEALLVEARERAHEAGDEALRTVIIAVLSRHLGTHLKEAMDHGAHVIRQLYAASADTLPTAAQALAAMAQYQQ